MATILDAVKWTTYNDYQGPVYRGSLKYNPKVPWSAWDRIVGCVARCEGAHDTVVMYDGTGITWGFQQWTLTSGRLQKVFQYLKSIPYYDLNDETESSETLFSRACVRNGKQIFEDFGFKIESGNFVELPSGKILDPSFPAQKNRIVDICLGKVKHPSSFAKQKDFAKALCAESAIIAQFYGVPEAQAAYAKEELKRALPVKRSPLGEFSTIENLLGNSLETAVSGLFFNLWQNNPGAAYKLFKTARYRLGNSSNNDQYLKIAWQLLNNSGFGNWSYQSGYYKKNGGTPRIVRIKAAIKEFYDLDLAIVK